MLFCSSTFVLFFLVVFTLYWAAPSHRLRVWVLLAASYVFYACWNHWLALVLVVSSAIDFCLGRGMEATASAAKRRLLLLASLVGNVGLLCYFKYSNFFLRSLEEAAETFGLTMSLPVLKVLLPVGISFYAFEAINYAVDVYRGKIRAERNLAHFMLFILFFPHLVAGPIVRASDFLPLVGRRKRWSWLRASVGVRLIVLGMLKKLAVADRLALYVDPVYADPTLFGSAAVWLATIAYAIQIYCDFSGYSDMALGLAHLLGFHLAVNFNMPFLAANVSELWRRWHISLSSWIRDYIFIPLGGSRGTSLRTYRNILVTMTLCGLWHGSNWTYVVWGALNGGLLIVHAAFRPWCERRPLLRDALLSAPGTSFRVALTFLCFCLTFTVFRSPTLAGAGEVLTRLFVPTSGASLTLQPLGLYLTFAAVLAAHALGTRDRGVKLWERLPMPIRGLSYGTAVAFALVAVPSVSKAFIYFQF